MRVMNLSFYWLRLPFFILCAYLLALLSACSIIPNTPAPADAKPPAMQDASGSAGRPISGPDSSSAMTPRINFLPDLHPISHWLPARWEDLPQHNLDNPREALGAWLASCARPQAAWRLVCNELSALKNADPEVLRIWMQSRLQPYAVTLPPDSNRTAHEGVLTGYYEPIFKATRTPQGAYQHPLYRPPAVLEKNKSVVWLTRQAMESQLANQGPAAQELAGRVIAYLDEPLDVLALQIQGSGLLDVVGSDGKAVSRIRVAFAATNNQPYASVGNWLRQTHGVRELSWPAIRSWAKQNPSQLNPLLWSNPRVVFFREESVPSVVGSDAQLAPGPGPRGAAGIALTAGRSIAVDPQSIPYGTPVWLASSGDSISLSRLVLAQDTGAAIRGAVRADFYVGSGFEAGEIAGRLKQPLQLWVLWPK